MWITTRELELDTWPRTISSLATRELLLLFDAGLLLGPSLFLQHNSLPLDDSVKEVAWSYYPVKQGSVGVERGNLGGKLRLLFVGRTG